MKKSCALYTVIWAIALALFNVCSFVIAPQTSDTHQLGHTFWIGYAFITLAFVGQLVCAYIALTKKNRPKVFYHLSLLSVSYGGLLIMLFVGGTTMAMPQIPVWIGITACVLVLGVTIIALTNAGWAAQLVADTDDAIQARTAFIKELTTDAQNLMSRAGAPMLKEQCEAVYEALRYSDPVSHEKLNDVEKRIQEEFDALTDAVLTDHLDDTESAAKELITLIRERNAMCKTLK